MTDDAAPSAATAPLALDTSDESATAALYRAAIGPVGADHYLPIFARFELADRVGSGWNWAAGLCTLGWMTFRRMGFAALVYLGVVMAFLLAGGVLAGLLLPGLPQVQIGLALALMLPLFVLPGMYGDAWLYAHSRKRMARALAQSASWNDAVALLEREAVTPARAWWLTAAHGGVLAAGVVASLTLFDLPAPSPPHPLSAPAAVSTATSAAAPAPAASALSSTVAPAPVAAPAEATAAAAATATSSASAAATSSATATASATASTTASGKPSASGTTSATAELPLPRASAPAAAAASEVPAGRKSRPVQASAEPARAGASAPATRYYVNVGLFAVDTNARAAEARLRVAGLPVVTQELQMKNGTRTRVRAGPFQDLQQAEAAVPRIRALGLDALVAVPEAGSRP